MLYKRIMIYVEKKFSTSIFIISLIILFTYRFVLSYCNIVVYYPIGAYFANT